MLNITVTHNPITGVIYVDLGVGNPTAVYTPRTDERGNIDREYNVDNEYGPTKANVTTLLSVDIPEPFYPTV